jgi:osmotically-inducible protein OsmY
MEHRGRFGSRYEDDDERRRDFERGWDARRYRGEAYSGGYYGTGRSDWRDPNEREGRDRDWERESSWSARDRDRDRERGRDERNFIDRVTDEVRSWFGDEDAERRRRKDIREMYGRESHEERDRWDRGRSWTAERGPGRVDRSDFLGRERDEERSRGDREDVWSRSGTGAGGWAPRGPYSGRGPRGYQRSDDRIREDVCECLSQHGMLDATEVDVIVVAGDVTLRGSVPSRWAKREAEDLTESVSGVRDVHNELRVSQPGTSSSGTSYSSSSQSAPFQGQSPSAGSGTSQTGGTQTGFGRGGHEGEARGRVA